MPQVGSEGRYGNDGTVAQYLELQGVEPYLRAADRYYDAVVAVAGAVTAALPADAPAPDDETDRSRPAAAPQPAGDDVASDLPAEFLDLDAAAAAMAAASDIPLPPALEARLELHLAWLYQQASRGGSPAQD